MEISKALLQRLVQVGWSVNGMSSLVSSNPSYIDKSTVVIVTSIARGRPRSWAKWSATTVGVIGTFHSALWSSPHDSVKLSPDTELPILHGGGSDDS